LTTVCEKCDQAWQHGGGRDLAVSATDLAIAECDAQRVGSDREPGKAVQDVAPKVRRFVMLRDRKRCTVPGCRATRHIDVHHIEPQHLGGGHEKENLTLLCSGHHRALHEGLLIITGRAPDLSFVWKSGVIEADAADVDASQAPDLAADARHELPPHVGQDECCAGTVRVPPPPETGNVPEPSKYEWTVKKNEVIAAMKQMGFSKDEARALVEQAIAELPRSASHEQLVLRALRVYRTSAAGATLTR
jgi:hypothetical protein